MKNRRTERHELDRSKITLSVLAKQECESPGVARERHKPLQRKRSFSSNVDLIHRMHSIDLPTSHPVIILDDV